VLTRVVKWSERLINRVSIIIRSYIDHMTFAASMAFVCFCKFFKYGILLLCILINITFILIFILMYSYCYVWFVLDIPLHCVILCMFLCKSVLFYCHWVSTQLQLTNVSYQTALCSNSSSIFHKSFFPIVSLTFKHFFMDSLLIDLICL
jgi:hypothetical protein